MDKKYEVKLSLKELILLDGKVSESVQKIIETAKKENSVGFELPVMNEIILRSEETGKLNWAYKEIRNCRYCEDKPYDYNRYPRNGKYHNKGDKNYDKPKYYRGLKFNEGFVTVTGLGDMCSDCCEKHNVIENLVNYIINNDLKIEIQKNNFVETKYVLDKKKICYKCDSEMYESEMKRKSTVMGNGTFASGCPSCGAESSAFGYSHKHTNEFRHILNSSKGNG